MLTLFDVMRGMTIDMAAGIPESEFDVPRGNSNSPKWITGHLALCMDFGLSLLGKPAEKIESMMPIYGPGSPGGAIGDDGRSQEELIAHLKASGDLLRDAVLAVDADYLTQPQPSPFLTKELPLIGDMLGHLITTHLSMHCGQLSQIRRECGLPSILQIG